MSTLPYYGSALKLPGRMLVAEATKDNDDDIPGPDDCWLSKEFDKYLTRTAHMCIVSNRGSSPLTLATQTSDKYDGRPVWQPGITVAAGDEFGWCNTVYEALDSGPTGTTAPTHLSGDASDGLRLWRFKERIMRTPTVLNLLLDNDGLKDGMASWLLYLESVRRAGAGSTYSEWENKNCGDLVVNDPYNPQPSGNTISMRMVAGGDNSYGPQSANASTCGFSFESLTQKWACALNFAADAFHDHGGGVFIPIKVGPNQRFRQYAATNATGSDLLFNVTDTTQRVAVAMQNGCVEFRSLGYPMGAFENGDGAGVVVQNYIALVAHSDAVGYAEVKVKNTSGQTNRDLKLSPKGAGKVMFGTVQPITAPMAVTGYIEIKDASGVIRKLAVIE